LLRLLFHAPNVESMVTDKARQQCSPIFPVRWQCGVEHLDVKGARARMRRIARARKATRGGPEPDPLDSADE
jgi:hypothetical protein